MAHNRDNCIILLVDAPETDKINPDLKTAFGPERAVHVNGDLMSSAYRLAKGFNEAIMILSYEKTLRHPDLTWLDPEDPGFLEVKSRTWEERARGAFQLAFFTGAKKAVLVNHLTPDIKKEWLYQAFDSVTDKTVAVGPNNDGTFYLLGLTQPNLRILDAAGFSAGKTAENLSERAKKAKLAVFNTPESYAVTGEETLLKWMEAKEALPPLFHHAEPLPAHNHEPHKKHHKRHSRAAQELPADTPPENPPL